MQQQASPSATTTSKDDPPRLAKRQRDDWEELVDLIAADKSSDTSSIASLSGVSNVPTLASLLPKPVTTELRSALEAYGPAFDAAQKQSFQPQLSVMDGYHARPIPIRSSDMFSKKLGPGSSHSDAAAAASSTTEDGSDGSLEQLMSRKAAAIAPIVTRIAQKLPGGKLAIGGRSLEQLTTQDLLFGSTEGLTKGFRRQKLLDSRYARPDFLPIILIPSGPTAAIQLFNVRSFLEEGVYVHPTQSYMSSGPMGDTSREDAKPENVVVSPKAFFSADTLRNSAFSKFRVVDDPRKVDNWDHVCGCIVTGVEWQLREWFQNDDSMKHLAKPSALFDFLRGFLVYFEEDKLPAALLQWNVHPLVLNRKYVKAKAHIFQAYTFWEELYRFISTNPRFAHYVASGVDE
jgi:parafibromin